jgi:hypothetical protein
MRERADGPCIQSERHATRGHDFVEDRMLIFYLICVAWILFVVAEIIVHFLDKQ